MSFDAFPPDTLAFLADLKANNDKAWFNANRSTHEHAVKQPAKQFCAVAVMEASLERLTGLSHTGKVFRINRDLRFSKDKTPYNTHLHIGFQPDGNMALPAGWSFGLAPEYLSLGVGSFGFDKAALELYRDRVAGEAGAALADRLNKLLAGSARMGGEPELKRVPRGLDPDHPRAAMLRRKSLSVWIDLDSPEHASRPSLCEDCEDAFRMLLPVFDWFR